MTQQTCPKCGCPVRDTDHGPRHVYSLEKCPATDPAFLLTASIVIERGHLDAFVTLRAAILQEQNTHTTEA